jgi:hypothetical protein
MVSVNVDPPAVPAHAEPARPLAVWPCQSICVWRATGEVWGDSDHGVAGPRVFACAGCGSEWVRTEAWTPIDANGEIPEAIAVERRQAG